MRIARAPLSNRGPRPRPQPLRLSSNSFSLIPYHVNTEIGDVRSGDSRYCIQGRSARRGEEPKRSVGCCRRPLRSAGLQKGFSKWRATSRAMGSSSGKMAAPAAEARCHRQSQGHMYDFVTPRPDRQRPNASRTQGYTRGVTRHAATGEAPALLSRRYCAVSLGCRRRWCCLPSGDRTGTPTRGSRRGAAASGPGRGLR